MQRGSSLLRGSWQRRQALKRVVEQEGLLWQTRGVAAFRTGARDDAQPPVPALVLINETGRSGLRHFTSSVPTPSWASQPCVAPASESAAGAPSERQKTAETEAETSTSGGQERKGEAPPQSREIDASKEELVQMLAEREVTLDEQGQQMKEMQDKVLRTLAEMENLRERTAREAENTRKFAIQGFAKALLDVADNLTRATAAVPEQFRKQNFEPTNDAEKALRSLLVGVNMTENQLQQVFKGHGMQRSDPLGTSFDPNLHNAVFEVEDASKAPGTVAHVMKVGYTLNDRVIRPADVGVVKAKE